MVDGAPWDRRGSRSDGASFTVATLARYLVHDPIHHLHDVTIDLAAQKTEVDRRALGSSVIARARRQTGAPACPTRSLGGLG